MRILEIIGEEEIVRDLNETEIENILLQFPEVPQITNDTELLEAINSVPENPKINAILDYIVGGEE